MLRVCLDDRPQCIRGRIRSSKLRFVELSQPDPDLDPIVGLGLDSEAALEDVGEPLGVVDRSEEPVERLVRCWVIRVFVGRLLVVRHRALRVRELLLEEPAEPRQQRGPFVCIVRTFELLLVNPCKSFPIADHDLEPLEIVEHIRGIRIDLEDPPEGLDRSPRIAELTVLDLGDASQE